MRYLIENLLSPLTLGETSGVIIMPDRCVYFNKRAERYVSDNERFFPGILELEFGLRNGWPVRTAPALFNLTGHVRNNSARVQLKTWNPFTPLGFLLASRNSSHGKNSGAET